MDLNETLLVLQISEDQLKEIDLYKLKKIYHTLALKHHPDKGGNEEDFKKLNDAYNNLTVILLQKLNDSSDKHNDIKKYMNYFFDILKGNYDLNKDIIQLISKIINDFLLHVKENKDCYIELLKLIRININTKINENVPIKYIELKPSLSDILENNVFRLVYKNDIYFVPLWHKEVVFDHHGEDFIVKNNPQLPNNIYIDNVSNVHIIIHESISNMLIDKYIFKIENKEFILNTNKLYIRENQIAVLKNVGISKINIEDIYDIDEKNDVIVHLYLH